VSHGVSHGVSQGVWDCVFCGCPCDTVGGLVVHLSEHHPGETFGCPVGRKVVSFTLGRPNPTGFHNVCCFCGDTFYLAAAHIRLRPDWHDTLVRHLWREGGLIVHFRKVCDDALLSQVAGENPHV
jgi:hypothetical protein